MPINILIVHNFAHRLTGFGIIESTPVKVTTTQTVIDNSQWQHRAPQSMDMTGADVSEVQSQLQRMNAIFYDVRARTPKAESIVG